MKKILIIQVIFLIISCKNEIKTKPEIDNVEIEEGVTISQITSDYDSLICRVKYQGDIDAYDELYYGFMDANEIERTDSVMYYSKIMAEKYNNEKAYFDHLKAICDKNKIEFSNVNLSILNISKLNQDSKKQIEDWLKKMLDKKIITQKQYDSVIR